MSNQNLSSVSIKKNPEKDALRFKMEIQEIESNIEQCYRELLKSRKRMVARINKTILNDYLEEDQLKRILSSREILLIKDKYFTNLRINLHKIWSLHVTPNV